MNQLSSRACFNKAETKILFNLTAIVKTFTFYKYVIGILLLSTLMLSPFSSQVSFAHEEKSQKRKRRKIQATTRKR